MIRNSCPASSPARRARGVALGIVLAVSACGGKHAVVEDAAVGDFSSVAAGDLAGVVTPADGFVAGGDLGTSPDLAPTCNGYEPCGVYPVAAPAGYTIEKSPGLTVNNLVAQVSCASFEDCSMWNTHYTSNWTDPSGMPYPTYYNRMGAPFPTAGSRYIIDVAANLVMYVPFKMTSPNEYYRYSDGTLETQITRATGDAVCFQRGPGHLSSAWLEDLGGTGNIGQVNWNISVLPGDMGNTGNVSTCQGAGNTTRVLLTSDENLAKTTLTSTGMYVYCLLREGQTYYVNFTATSVGTKDCTKVQCSMGGFVFANATTSDGGPLLNPVACPSQ